MSWSGIFLVHVPEGVSPQSAVDETIVGWVANPSVPGSHLTVVPDLVEIKHDPEWSTRALEAVLGVNPDLLPVEDTGFLDDGVGPVYVQVYGKEAQLMPKKFWENPDDLDGFAIMWSYCVALGRTGCVAHDPDEEELIDLSIDVETARSWYNWI
jgi:hypothetical protein